MARLTRWRPEYELPWLSEDDPYARRAVTRYANRLGYTLHPIRSGVWGLWQPPVDDGDPFASRPVYVGPWHRIKAHLSRVERESRKGF